MKWFFLTIGAILLVLIGIPFSVLQVFFRLCLVVLKWLSLGSFESRYTLGYYFKQIRDGLTGVVKANNMHELAVSFDDLTGSLIFGSKYTVSAITGYKSYKGNRFYKALEKFIDKLFGDGHCNKNAWKEGLITDGLVEKNLKKSKIF